MLPKKVKSIYETKQDEIKRSKDQAKKLLGLKDNIYWDENYKVAFETKQETDGKTKKR